MMLDKKAGKGPLKHHQLLVWSQSIWKLKLSKLVDQKFTKLKEN